MDAQRATRKMLDDFILETGWRPGKAVPVASALTDSVYGPVIRSLMRKLLRRTFRTSRRGRWCSPTGPGSTGWWTGSCSEGGGAEQNAAPGAFPASGVPRRVEGAVLAP